MSRERWTIFGVYVNGQKIAAAPIRHQFSTGIELTAPLDGLVATYEQREAARFALVNWTDFEALSKQAQAATIAHYRVYHAVQAHQEVAIEREGARRRGNS